MRTLQAPPLSRHPRDRAGAAPMPPIHSRAYSLLLDEGLYAVTVGPVGARAGRDAIMLPAIRVSSAPSEAYDPVELGLGTAYMGEWFAADGGTIIAKASPGGGVLLVTAYAAEAGDVAVDLDIDVRRLDGAAVAPAPRPVLAAAPALAPAPAERELRREIILHIEREGDRRFDTAGWIGHRGERIRIEAFGIRPLEALAAGDIEYKAYGPNRRETPWVSDGRLCGTRGHGLPLTGFAIRLAPSLGDRFTIVYSGSYFAGGVSGPVRDGEPCLPALHDDPLEAMQVQLIERA